MNGVCCRAELDIAMMDAVNWAAAWVPDEQVREVDVWCLSYCRTGWRDGG